VGAAEETASERQDAPGMSWTKLLRRSVVAAIVVVALINLFAGVIPPLVVFALVWIGALWWLGRSTKGPATVLLVSFVAFLVLSARFVIPTLTVPASAGDFILNVGSVLAALTGIAAAIAVLRAQPGRSGAPLALGRTAAGVFAVASIFSIVSTVTYDDAVAQPGDVELVTRDIEFEPASIESDAGTVSVFVANEGSTLHTFTIDDLGVDLDIPASKSARVTFDAEPGTYEFYCVPHEGDMEGTLTVE
jgi:plastocyanin